MNAKQTSPSVRLKAFNCPHCRAYANQIWYNAHASSTYQNSLPEVVLEGQLASKTYSKIQKTHEMLEAKARDKKLSTGLVFLKQSSPSIYAQLLENIHFSECAHCQGITIWKHSEKIWPLSVEVDPPNDDMPPEVISDYIEAANIVAQSPRGAAALLRLALQKICRHLGGDGKNIDNDIAKMVESGLDKRVQQALDVVRVIGNNAVHPGQIDLKDDRDTARKLFGLLNLITDIMITQPKHVSDMFNSLPDGAKAAIQKRDAPKSS